MDTPVVYVVYLRDMKVIQEWSSTKIATVHDTRGLDLSGSPVGAGGIDGILTRSSGYNSFTGAWSIHDYFHTDGPGSEPNPAPWRLRTPNASAAKNKSANSPSA